MKFKKSIGNIGSLAHQSLNLTAVASAIAAVIVGVLYFVDGRELLGVSVWEKPLKFFISAAFYSVTFSWLFSYVEKGVRFARAMGHIIAATLGIELLIIVGLAAVGVRSHFNVSSPFHIWMWSIMAAAITAAWVATFLLGTTLWKSTRMSDEIRLAVRWALGIGLAGMGIAFTMTTPQPNQTTADGWQGIAGAHTVGAADGGAGIPFFGWSIEAGDLRVSHFLGLHGLQAIPLATIILLMTINNHAYRVAAINAIAVLYAGLVVVTYVQALRGESILSPSTTTINLLELVVLAALVAGAWTRFRKAKIPALS